MSHQRGSGNLYATTAAGGAVNQGAIVKLSPSGQLSTFASFGNTGARNPRDGLTVDAFGNMYGTTALTSGNGPGNLFKLTPDGTLSTIVQFNNTNGSQPTGDLLLDAAGNLYGTTEGGGSAGAGTIFKIAADGTFSTVVSFNGTTNGSNPSAGLIADAAGNLYGTTFAGGTADAGTAFKLATDGTLTTLASLDYANGGGYQVQAGLTADAAGNLYGTIYAGGVNNRGTIYKLSITGFVVPEPATLATFAAAGLSLVSRLRTRA